MLLCFLVYSNSLLLLLPVAENKPLRTLWLDYYFISQDSVAWLGGWPLSPGLTPAVVFSWHVSWELGSAVIRWDDWVLVVFLSVQGKPQRASPFQAPASFAEVLLVKASHVDKPRVGRGGRYAGTGTLRGIMGHYQNDTPLYLTPHKASKLCKAVYPSQLLSWAMFDTTSLWSHTFQICNFIPCHSSLPNPLPHITLNPPPALPCAWGLVDVSSQNAVFSPLLLTLSSLDSSFHPSGKLSL